MMHCHHYDVYLSSIISPSLPPSLSPPHPHLPLSLTPLPSSLPPSLSEGREHVLLFLESVPGPGV